MADLPIERTLEVPPFTYCGVVNMVWNRSQLVKLDRLLSRAKRIINGTVKVPDIKNEISKRAVVMTFQCIKNNYLPSVFDNYFTMMSHNKATRNNNCSLIIPKVKLECTKKGFFYQGTVLFNKLPIEIRKSLTVKEFINKVKNEL